MANKKEFALKQAYTAVSLILLGVVLVLILRSTSSSNPSIIQSKPGQQTTTQSTSTANGQSQLGLPTTPIYSQDNSNYVYAYLSALSYLYQSTQSYIQAQNMFGSNTSDSTTVILTAIDETVTYLQDAGNTLYPYIDNNDPKISATAKLLYADTERELNDASQLQASLTYGVKNQNVGAFQGAQTELAALAADKNSLQNDLQQEVQIIKYIIQNPTNDTHPSGPIDYAISPANRSYLLQQINMLFPTLNATTDHNYYLLYAHVISILMSSETYEQQSQAVSQL